MKLSLVLLASSLSINLCHSFSVQNNGFARQSVSLGVTSYLQSLGSDQVPTVIPVASSSPSSAPSISSTVPSSLTTAVPSSSDSLVKFEHRPFSYFAIENLKVKGPRANADVGEPFDATRPLGKDGKMSTGSWFCTEGGWPSPKLRDTTEVFYVFSGNGCLTDLDGTRNYFGPGDIVILPKGWSGRWDVFHDIHKVWAVFEHDDVPSVVTKATIKNYNTFSPQYMTSSETNIGSCVSSASTTFLDNGHMSVGTKIYSEGSFDVVATRETESLHFLEGRCYIANSDGSAQACVAGDTVLLPKGWTGRFDVIDSAKMMWVKST